MRGLRSNAWNRILYAVWAPVYDLLVEHGPLARARRRAFELLAPERGRDVLLVGAGTGADLPHLPAGTRVVGVDLSEAMLRRARERPCPPDGSAEFLVADAQELPFREAQFDVTVLHLILSVVPDGRRALQEAVRVTRPGGRLLVFDKFRKPDRRPGVGRRLLNLLTNLFGTDINRDFEAMREGLPCRVVRDEAVLFSGSYRAVVLEKQKN